MFLLFSAVKLRFFVRGRFDEESSAKVTQFNLLIGLSVFEAFGFLSLRFAPSE